MGGFSILQPIRMNNHHTCNPLFIFALWLTLCVGAPSCKTSDTSLIHDHDKATLYQDSIYRKRDFSEIRSTFDTLIPIMNGLFITYNSFDYSAYRDLIDAMMPQEIKVNDSVFSRIRFFAEDGLDGFETTTEKWGVIDSTGKIIVPFVCDAVREIENGKGVFSIYKGSHSLNTGIPRYSYSGYCYFFNENGYLSGKGKLFDLTTVFIADFHRAEFVILNGNTFYLPDPFRVITKSARGTATESPYPYRK